MNRRDFFQTSLIATLAGTVLADRTLAQAGRGGAAAPAAPAVPRTPRALSLDAYSRFLHWLRDPNEIAEACIEITCGGLMVTVGGGNAHVDAAKVTTDLPAFVNTIRKHGLKVRQIRGGGQNAVDPALETLVGTMSQLGITHYWIGGDSYDFTKPVMPQLDAIKLKVEKFVALNQKHGTTLMYHTRAGANSVGSVVWDLLYVLKDFDPKHVGLHWDTGHMSHHGDMWETLMRTAGPYVTAVSWKDRTWQQNLPFRGEGGPFPGPAPLEGAAGRGGAGGGRGGRGGAPAAAGAPGAPAGAAAPAGGGRGGRGGAAPVVEGAQAPAGGRGAAPAGGRGGAAGGDGDGPPAAAGGRGAGGGGARGRGGDLSTVPRPLAGTTFARGSGWTSPYTPMGMGLVDIFQYAVVLADMNFNGPMELEVEYPLGGANSGASTLTLPRIQVIGAIKRDVLTIRAALQQSGSGLSI